MPENTTPRAHLDPRNPFVIDIRRLDGSGSMITDRRRVPAPAGLRHDLAGVPEGAPLDLDLLLESATEGVLVTGMVMTTVTGECGRCLDPVTDEIAVAVCELFAYPGSATAETTDEDEVDRVVDDMIDVEPVVRDAVVLGLPLTPLCRSDCAGLCPTCGQRLEQLPAGHAHEELDPRWAALTEWNAGGIGSTE
jgi:DUF177 domain-containing protein